MILKFNIEKGKTNCYECPFSYQEYGGGPWECSKSFIFDDFSCKEYNFTTFKYIKD